MKRIFLAAIIVLITFGINAAEETIEEKTMKLIFSWQMEEAEKNIKKTDNPPDYVSGIYHFYKGDYEKAFPYLSNSKPVSEFWLDIIGKNMPVIQKFRTLETKYFRIRYTGRDEVLAVYLSDIADKAVEELHERLNWKPKEKAIIEIYPTRKSFQTASTLTDKHIKVSGAIGICKFNRIMISSPRILKFGYSWADTVTHEYVHFIIGHVTGLVNMPLWMNEGLAKHLEECWRKKESSISPVGNNFLVRTRDSGNWVELNKMKHGMPSLETSDEVTLAFAQVQSMTGFLVREYGWDKVTEFLNMIRDEDADSSFEKIFGTQVSGFQKNWEEYIKSRDIEITPGASAPSFAFSEEPVNAVSEWVSETAVTDLTIADRFKEAGKHEFAVKKYLAALEKDTGNPVILNKLAKVQIITGSTKEAKKNFLSAIKANPSYAPPYLHLGELLFKEKEYKKAQKYIKEYIYISPFNPMSHEMLLEIYKETKEKKKEEREEKILSILSEH
ncbi:peptidase MA family metallohydrolase [Elusimicrobiota bacterium]